MIKLFFINLIITILLIFQMVSAATFDSNLLPGNDNQYEVSYANQRWKNISISNLLNLGQLSADPGGAQNGSIYYNTANKVFRGYASGTWATFSDYWNASGTTIYYNNGNVGIGTSTPNNLFQVYDLISFPSSTGSAFLGYQAGNSTSSGFGNTFVGYRAGRNNTTGSYNTAVGAETLKSNTTGDRNTAAGLQALYSNTTGIDNTALGWGALLYNTTGSFNTAVGDRSLMGESYAPITGNNNTAIGPSALNNNGVGYNNTAIGYDAGAAGYSNTAIGKNAFNGNGYQNTALGNEALYNVDNGNNNVAIGIEAGYGSGGGYQSHSKNVFLGYRAGYLIANSGDGNVLLGYQAGDNITNGYRNIIIGYDIDASSAGSNYQLNIGNLIFGTDLDGIGTTISSGKIGIATTTPQSTLHIPDNKYVQIEDNNSGFAPSNDCNSNSQIGRISFNTASSSLAVCLGAAGWKYAILNN